MKYRVEPSSDRDPFEYETDAPVRPEDVVSHDGDVYVVRFVERADPPLDGVLKVDWMGAS